MMTEHIKWDDRNNKGEKDEVSGNRIHLIGNAHLDPVWLWRWQEGFAEIKATFRSALDRMNEFPEFMFTCACAAYYKWVEENEPAMFEEIRKRVREGRWVIVGGWWIQPDCNLPSGEAFARHSLYSQRYFREKFGRMARVGYNVDSFGHHGMLPQILKKSGMDYYLFMRPDSRENGEVPGDLFQWESSDGSRVLTFRIPNGYGHAYGDPSSPVPMEKQKFLAIRDMAEEQQLDYMGLYGVGNHGGGPTIATLKLICEMQEEWGGDRLVHSSPEQYFAAVDGKYPALPVHRDDLQHHASGCYSTYSAGKASNRKAEHRLLTAEKTGALAQILLGCSYDRGRLERAWHKVMFNHFHDIMGGCSIREAYADAQEFYGEALTAGAEVLNAAVQRISWAVDTMGLEPKCRSKEKDWYLWEEGDKGTPFLVFNPHSWEVEAPVTINKQVRGITDESGEPVVLQTVRGPQTNGMDIWNTLFMAKLPSMGYRLYWVYLSREIASGTFASSLTAGEYSLENECVKLQIDPHSGYIASLYDKRSGLDVLDGFGAVPVVIDITHCDTWAHGIFEFRKEVGRFTDAEVRVLENGPVRAKLRVTSRYNQSVLRQEFTLCSGKADIGVEVKLDWREQHKMLKLAFPVRVSEPVATYEIPYGHIRRPVNGEEEPGQQWIDVTGTVKGEKAGLALLNDGKYSFDILGNEMRMTVANSSIFADHFGRRDEFCEFMDQGIQEFSYMLVPHQGGWETAGVVKKACELNVKPVGIMETYHSGPLPQKQEGIRISANNVIAAAFKAAEDGDGYILRCYETDGSACDAVLELPTVGRKWQTHFGNCEIKTFHIPLEPEKEITERNLLEI